MVFAAHGAGLDPSSCSMQVGHTLVRRFSPAGHALSIVVFRGPRLSRLVTGCGRSNHFLTAFPVKLTVGGLRSFLLKATTYNESMELEQICSRHRGSNVMSRDEKLI